MARLARGRGCGETLAKAASRPSRLTSPSRPKPVPVFCNISRRVSPGANGMKVRSVDIEKFVRSKESLCVLLPARGLARVWLRKEIARRRKLARLGVAAEENSVSLVNPVFGTVPFEARYKLLGAIQHKRVVQHEKLLNRR